MFLCNRSNIVVLSECVYKILRRVSSQIYRKPKDAELIEACISVKYNYLFNLTL